MWALLGPKTGDNAQVQALAERLPGRVEFKQLEFNISHVLPNILQGASTRSLTPLARQMLAPPWPDAVIAVGKRSAPVALWIAAQSQGKTKLVHLGRPRAPLKKFDLVITTPQYGLPKLPNVMEIMVPFTSPVEASDLARWRAEWAGLPRPLIAVAIGAAKFPLRFGASERAALARQLDAFVGTSGGSVLLLGSPRTPRGAIDRVAQDLSAPHRAYGEPRKLNPYRAALLLGDRLLVTSDSASMLADALNTGKPVEVFRLPSANSRWVWDGYSGVGAMLASSGLVQPPRTIDRLVNTLTERSFVRELGSTDELTPFNAGYDEAVTRVLGLFAKRKSHAGEA
jgi:uncharacterized protein